ncbi:MAG: hypothetical protein MI741_11630 [Rhodospirillales bacterium]|nr:hypothetical protein [Rhodospirillales bacterium]
MPKTYRIKCYPPLDSVVAPECDIELASSARLDDFLSSVLKAYPGLGRYARRDPESGEVLGLMVLQGDVLLKRADTVSDGEIIEVLPAIDGG